MRILLVAVLALVVGCTSPEASRARGQAGADPGNRTSVIDMHGPTDPGHGTPRLGKAVLRSR